MEAKGDIPKDVLAEKIDHTLLKKEATKEEIKNLCEEAIKYNFKAVCVYPHQISWVKEFLKEKKTIPIAVIDFPMGEKTPQEKEKQTKAAKSAGAKEIDMVIDISSLQKKNYKKVFEGIQKVVLAAHPFLVKVIIEANKLSREEKIIACALAKAGGAMYVKTGTGCFGGVQEEDVILMKEIVGESMGVKASGGIKTKEQANQMIHAGADRIGASSSIQIMEGYNSHTS